MAQNLLVKFNDFSKGFVDAKVNPLTYPKQAFVGQDIDIVNNGLRTRPGYTPVSSGSLPNGEVQVVEQVRFPKNEKKYTLAQVKGEFRPWDHSSDSGPAPGALGAYCWDSYRGVMWWLTASEYGGAMCRYSWDDDTWLATLEIETPGDGYLAYDETNDQLLLVGSDASLNVFDCEAETWSEVSVTGDLPAHFGPTSAVWVPDKRIVVVITSSSELMWHSHFKLNVDTGAWTEVEGTSAPDYNESGYYPSVALLEDNVLHVLGGHSGELGQRPNNFLLDLDTDTWAEKTPWPLGIGFTGFTAACGNKVLCLDSFNGYLIYDSGTDKFTETATPVWPYTEGASEPYYVDTLLVTDDGNFIITHKEYVAGLGDIYRVGRWPDGCLLRTGIFNRLYASPDALPTTAAQFTKIADLSPDAEPVSTTVLGDRAIIADSKDNTQDWGGCMDDTGDDWIFPKNVLALADGVTPYDISSQVCDSDPDTVANIGDFGPTGLLDIICDLPEVAAFLFDMQTVNTGLSGASSQLSEIMGFSSVNSIQRYNLQGSITSYTQDSGVAGHFNYAATPVTPGCQILFSDGTTAIIISKSGDGTGASAITLDAAHSNATVIGIYGTMFQSLSQTNIQGSIATYTVNSGNTGHFNAANSSVGVGANIIFADGTTAVITAKTGDGTGTGAITLNQAHVTGNISAIYATVSSESAAIGISYGLGSTAHLNLIGSVTTFTPEASPGSSLNTKGHFDVAKASGVVVGCVIYFSDGTSAVITALVGDGTTANSVTLSIPRAVSTVSAIYGNALWYKRPTGYSNYPNTSLRIRVAGGVTTTGRLTFTFLSLAQAGADPLIGNTATIAFASIAEEDASFNTKNIPTQITFNGGQAGAALMAGVPLQSDPLSFVLDSAKDYIVTLDLMGVAYTYTKTVSDAAPFSVGGNTGTHTETVKGYKGYLVTAAGSGFAYKAWDGLTTHAAYNKDVVTGFTTVANQCIGLINIQGSAIEAVASNMQVACTTDLSQVQLANVTSLDSVQPYETVPGNSVLWHAFSFDGRQTYWIWNKTTIYQIVRYDSGHWQYRAGASTWTNATVDSLLGALLQAFGVSANQMPGDDMADMTSAEWMGTNGIDLTVERSLDFAWAFTKDGTNIPELGGYVVNFTSPGIITLQGYQDGAFTDGDGWTDGTQATSNVSLSQSGIISYNGATPFKATYATINGQAGFHYILKINGTSPGTAITQIKYKAPCQRLQNIASGVADLVENFTYCQAATALIQDFSAHVSNDVNSILSAALLPMAVGDWAYVMNDFRFCAFSLSFISGGQNSNAASLIVQYWNGKAWISLTVDDNTSNNGCTMSVFGSVAFAVPSDWQPCIPIPTATPMGYAIRFGVSAALSSNTAVAQVRVLPVPDDLKKYRMAAVYGNQLALAGRPDFPDETDISAPFCEYQFNGAQASAWRVGGADTVRAMLSMWDCLLVAKAETWHIFDGNRFMDVEASRHTPVNSRVCVKAPVPGSRWGGLNGLYFINEYGAWQVANLQADAAYGSARVACLSEAVSWWDSSQAIIGSPGFRIDTSSLYRACGVYWPVRNWIVWAVPLIEAGSSSQSTNNFLIIFDISRGIWLPPWKIAVASLCTAYEDNPNAPGRLGALRLLAGTYDGRIISLMDGTTDDGSVIPSWIFTGWLPLDMPEYEKLIRRMRMYGVSDADITVQIYSDGETTLRDDCPAKSVSGLTGLVGKDFTFDDLKSLNNTGNFYRIGISFAAYTDLFGFEIEVPPIREEKLR